MTEFLKKYWPLLVAGVVILVLGSFCYSFKQEISFSKSETLKAQQALLDREQALADLRLENKTLSEQVSKEKSKTRFAKEYYPNGQLHRETGESSNSTESQITELSTTLQAVTTERDELHQKVDQMDKELAIAYEKETVRKGGIGIGPGLNFDGSSFKPCVVGTVRVIEILGLDLNANAVYTP